MAIHRIVGAGPAPLGAGGASPRPFAQLLKGPTGRPPGATPPQPAGGDRGAAHPPGGVRVSRGGVEGLTGGRPTSLELVERVSQAQGRMEEVLRLAESGKSFSPAELLSLQARVYRASQELDLAGKVVEKATGGVKQVLQTQV